MVLWDALSRARMCSYCSWVIDELWQTSYCTRDDWLAVALSLSLFLCLGGNPLSLISIFILCGLICDSGSTLKDGGWPWNVILENGQVCCNGSIIAYPFGRWMGGNSLIPAQALQEEQELSGVVYTSPFVRLVTSHVWALWVNRRAGSMHEWSCRNHLALLEIAWLCCSVYN